MAPNDPQAKDAQALGAWLKAQREEAGFSLRAAAKKAGISHARLGDLERGVSHSTLKPTQPRRDVAERIAKAYGVPLDRLAEVAGWGRLPEVVDPDLQALMQAFMPLSSAKRRLVLAMVQAALAADGPESPPEQPTQG